MKTGDIGIVIGYEGGGKAYRQKLLRMGLVKGCQFNVVRVAPLGDPIELEINSSNITVRRSEVEVLVVERKRM